jgi:hypothetical protein
LFLHLDELFSMALSWLDANWGLTVSPEEKSIKSIKNLKRKLTERALTLRPTVSALLLKSRLCLAEGDHRQSAQLALRAVEAGSDEEATIIGDEGDTFNNIFFCKKHYYKQYYTNLFANLKSREINVKHIFNNVFVNVHDIFYQNILS